MLVASICAQTGFCSLVLNLISFNLTDSSKMRNGMQGKLSRQDVAELCVELLSQQLALDTTF